MKFKFWQLLSCITITILLLSGCINGQNSGGSISHLGSETEIDNSASSISMSETNSKQSKPPVESSSPVTQPAKNSTLEEHTVKKIILQIGNTKFTATLENNTAVNAFEEMLREAPISIKMSDYSGFEKVGLLGASLPASNEQTTTQPGDIVLYGGNQIVIFYGSNSWSYTRLGKIEDISGLKDALGSGEVTVTFRIK